MCPEADGCEQTAYFKLIEQCVHDLLHDPNLKDCIDYNPKPLFTASGSRVFGPASSGAFWEAKQNEHPDKAIILVVCYSDGTEFYKGVTAHPVFGQFLHNLYTTCVQHVYSHDGCCSFPSEHQRDS